MKTLFPLLVLAALSATVARANLSFTIDTPDQSGMPGDTISFSGSVTNNGSAAVFLNGDSFSFALGPDDYVLDDDFFSTYPPSLDPMTSSGDIDLFTITLANPFSEPGGLYQGTVTLLGGVDENAQDIVGSADFSVTVDDAGDTPEPATAALAAGGLALLIGMRYALGGGKRRC